MVAQFSDFGLHSLLPCSLLYPLLHHQGDPTAIDIAEIFNSFFQLDIVGSASTFLYFGYTSVMVFCFFLLTGDGIVDLYAPIFSL